MMGKHTRKHKTAVCNPLEMQVEASFWIRRHCGAPAGSVAKPSPLGYFGMCVGPHPHSTSAAPFSIKVLAPGDLKQSTQ